jgi:hypothetical protein
MSTRVARTFWIVANTALVLGAFWTGYSEMSPAKLRGTNPDQYLCLAILICMPLSVVLAIGARHESLRRPSWDRSPFFLGRDPLQAVFVTTLIMFAVSVGSSLRISGAGAVGRWTVATYWSILVGLILGQIIAYIMYRDRITRAA